MHDIYLEIQPAHIAYVKFVVESYEEIGLIRTVDRKKAVIVFLVMNDFLATAREVLDSLKRDISIIEITRPADMTEDWFMVELSDKDRDT